MSKDDWRVLEQLVANIQRGLALNATVEHDVHLVGRITGVKRQVDILVTQMIGQYKMLIAIDCKDTKRPADTKCVEEFFGLVDDIGAHKGVLVCPAGFSTTAKKTAKHRQIDLYRPVDTGDHKWKVRATIPVLFDFRGASMSFGISTTAPLPFSITHHPAYFQVFDTERNPLGTALDAAVKRWNSGGFPSDRGEHEGCAIFTESEVLVDNGYGTLAPVDLFVGLHVKQVLYFGQLPIDRVSGFLDEHTGHVVTNSLTTGKINLNEIQNKWQKVDTIDELPVTPVLTLVGLECWPEAGDEAETVGEER